ncbi:flagellar basal body P-ring formation chaperone FlgA [Dasania sp. GY-MA-18]|uniref:Flagella basal body P-ring formation protein FlgA n=1 Tax=Dasania phycosphaerae TaxID=2950436 RepID=A0A9J6RHT8_9GAMM|nr:MULTISPECIES: flagellar basal body P-ring formation chaperone FlgA [Dasania]MCR8921404.1 flagellar basal body P-ring formation chaperone FlgA [Dasania sp. GY-MA-18]MCZ0863832.1 flagellar basal body P-ring formation chaperone FlgA [Dasania phycosphaerae]MCZ0867560.1 flagellar basal body P-ring formation chaperone FlgA [Dasania phycosphaerae]
MKARSFLIPLSVTTLLSTALAQAGTTVADIELSIQQFMDNYRQELQQRYPNASRISHQINALDSRLVMADCSQLTVERRDNSAIGRVNLKVSCSQPSNWSLYVPTDIALFHPIVVAAGPINKHTQLTAADLDLREVDLGNIRGSYYFDKHDVIDMETKRPLKPGAVIASGYLQAPLVIEKGDAVVLSAETGSLTVKAPAIALSDGRTGQQIRVQNRQSKRVIDARVMGPGAVQATL